MPGESHGQRSLAGCVHEVAKLDTTEQLTLTLDTVGPAPNEPLLPKPQALLPTPLVSHPPTGPRSLSVACVATPALSPEQPLQGVLQCHTATQGHLGPGTAYQGHMFPPGCQGKIHRPRSCRSPRDRDLSPRGPLTRAHSLTKHLPAAAGSSPHVQMQSQGAHGLNAQRDS